MTTYTSSTKGLANAASIAGVYLLVGSWLALTGINAYDLVSGRADELADAWILWILIFALLLLTGIVFVLGLAKSVADPRPTGTLAAKDRLPRVWLVVFLFQTAISLYFRSSVQTGVFTLALLASAALIVFAFPSKAVVTRAIGTFFYLLATWIAIGVVLDTLGLFLTVPEHPSRLFLEVGGTYLMRLSGLFPGVGYLGSASAVLVSMALVRGTDWKSLLGLCIGLLGLFLSDSRTGIGAVTLVALVIVLSQFVRRPSVRMQVQDHLTPAFVAIAGLAYIWALGTSGITSGLAARVVLWSSGIPWGRPSEGYGGEPSVSQFDEATMPDFVAGNPAHNLILEAFNIPPILTALRLGLIVLSVYLALWALRQQNLLALSLVAVPLLMGAISTSVNWLYPHTTTVALLLGVVLMTFPQSVSSVGPCRE